LALARYQLGWSDRVDYAFHAQEGGLDKDVVREIS